MKNSCTSPPFPRHYLSPPLLLRTSSLHPSPPRFCCYAILPGSRCYFKQFPLFLLGSTGRYNKPFLRPNAANYAFRSNRMLTFPCMQVGRAKIPRAGPSVLPTGENEGISIHPSPLSPQFRRCFHYVSTHHSSPLKAVVTPLHVVMRGGMRGKEGKGEGADEEMIQFVLSSSFPPLFPYVHHSVPLRRMRWIALGGRGG